jgi:hypothetical protein
MNQAATKTTPANVGPTGLTPEPVLSFPGPARLPSEFAPLVAWLKSGNGHDCHICLRGRHFVVDLLTRDRCVAVGVKPNLADAIADALRIVAEPPQ